MSTIFTQLLEQRQLSHDFIHPQYENCLDPFLLPDITPAIERLRTALKNHERVLIYGDYDVDGITASIVLRDTLVLAGFEPPEIMLPDRFKDGYGMNPKVVTRALETGVSLVFTVDCGSRNHEIVQELNSHHIDTIITDHHECADTLPPAVAVINPKRQDVNAASAPRQSAATHSASADNAASAAIPVHDAALSELRHLAGVGVAFKFAQALAASNLIPKGQEKWLLDLVAIGTICDSVPMTTENHRLCHYGFQVIQKTRRAGLKELLNTAHIKKLNSTAIGFQLGPRLNASGRLETPLHALNLLAATSRPAAAQLATKLETLNTTRRSLQESALADIQKQGVGDDPVIVVSGDWSEGILGIIASHLVELYRRPAFAFAPSADTALLKGSARSFGDFNLANALTACQAHLTGGGGHAAACGALLKATELNNFATAVNQYYRSLNLPDQTHFLDTKPDLAVTNFAELSLELIDELALLEPYGPNNLEPVFLLESARIIEVSRLGATGEHLHLLVWDQHEHPFKLLCFSAPPEYLKLQPGITADILITLTENTFRDTRSPEGRIIKIIT